VIVTSIKFLIYMYIKLNFDAKVLVNKLKDSMMTFLHLYLLEVTVNTLIIKISYRGDRKCHTKKFN